MIDKGSGSQTLVAAKMEDRLQSIPQTPKEHQYMRLSNRHFGEVVSPVPIPPPRRQHHHIYQNGKVNVLTQSLHHLSFDKREQQLSKSFSEYTSDSIPNLSVGLTHSYRNSPPLDEADTDSDDTEALMEGSGGYTPMYPLFPMLHHQAQNKISQKPPPVHDQKPKISGRSKTFHTLETNAHKQTLSSVLDSDSLVLPQILRVTRGQSGDEQQQKNSTKERETLRNGDFIIALCKKARYIVTARDSKGNKIVIPLNSQLKFVLAPRGVTKISEIARYSQGLYPNVERLLKQPHLPVVVRTTSTHRGETESDSVLRDRILFPKAIVQKGDIFHVTAKDLTGKHYCLRQDCVAGFSTKLNDTWLFISEIAENLSFPQNVFVATHQLLAASEVGGCRDLVESNPDVKSQLLTLTSVQQQHYLIGTKNYSTNLALEIPLDLDIEVECVSVKDNTIDGMNLLQTARDIFKEVEERPGQLVLSTEMTEREQDFQEELYKATGEPEDFVKLRGMAGGGERQEEEIESSLQESQVSLSHREVKQEERYSSREHKERPKSGPPELRNSCTHRRDSNDSGSPEAIEIGSPDTVREMRMELTKMKREHAQLKQTIDSFEKQLKLMEKEVKRKSKK